MEQNSIENMKLYHMEDNSETSTRADRQNASHVWTPSDFLIDSKLSASPSDRRRVGANWDRKSVLAPSPILPEWALTYKCRKCTWHIDITTENVRGIRLYLLQHISPVMMPPEMHLAHPHRECKWARRKTLSAAAYFAGRDASRGARNDSHLGRWGGGTWQTWHRIHVIFKRSRAIASS